MCMYNFHFVNDKLKYVPAITKESMSSQALMLSFNCFSAYKKTENVQRYQSIYPLTYKSSPGRTPQTHKYARWSKQEGQQKEAYHPKNGSTGLFYLLRAAPSRFHRGQAKVTNLNSPALMEKNI